MATSPPEALRISTIHGSDEVQDRTCDLCIQDNQEKEAKAFCTECMQYLCKDCHKTHSRANVSKTHKILTGEDMPEKKRNKPKYAAKCDKHPDSDLNIFCPYHRTVCCAKCKVLEHRSCGKTEKVSELSEKQNKDDNSLKLESLKVILNEFIRIQSVIDTLKSDLESQSSDIINTIKRERKELDKALDRLESDMIGKVDKEFERNEAELERHNNDINCFVDELKKQVAEHEDKLKTGSDEQVIVTSLVMESEIQKYNPEVHQFYSSFYKTDITFSLSTRLRDIHDKIAEFGLLKIDKSKADIQLPQSERQAVFLRDIDCKLPWDEKRVDISDLENLPDRKVIVSDFVNLKIKLFDSDSKLLSDVKVSSEQWNMAVMSSRDIVVTLPDENCLQHISIEDDETLKLNKRYKTKHQYFKLAKFDQNIIASWTDADYVYFDIIDIDGRRIRRVKKEPIKGGMFSSISSICLSPDQKVIYVIDGRNCYIGMSLTGEVVFRFQDDMIIDYWGMCAISDDCICVSGSKSRNVVMVQVKDKKVKEIVRLKEKGIGWMAYCQANGLLVVEMGDKSTRTPTVKVFSLVWTHWSYMNFQIKAIIQMIQLHNWAASWQNQQNDMCAQRRLR